MNYADSDGVTTVCYGKVQKWEDRSEARNFFLNAMMNSEGAERERYGHILYTYRIITITNVLYCAFLILIILFDTDIININPL